MDAGIAGLIGALAGAVIGGGVAITKSYIDSKSLQTLEAAKVEWARENQIATELREHVGSVSRSLLTCQHSLEWICSLTDDNSQLTAEQVANYHSEIHKEFPILLGELTVVSSLSDDAYKDLSVLSDQIFAIDGKIVTALHVFDTSPMDASRLVAEQKQDAIALYRELPRAIGQIMKSIRT